MLVWARLDSNQRATSYEPAALPLSYRPRGVSYHTAPVSPSPNPSVARDRRFPVAPEHDTQREGDQDAGADQE